MYTHGSLSDVGWTKSDGPLMARLFALFLVSLKSQSILYRGKIFSMPQLLAEYGNEVDQFVIELRITLEKLYEPHYKTVLVQTENLSSETETLKRVRMSVRATDENGDVFDLSKSMTYENNILKEVMDYVNN